MTSPWNSHKINLIGTGQDTNSYNEFEKYTCKNYNHISRGPMSWWIPRRISNTYSYTIDIQHTRSYICFVLVIIRALRIWFIFPNVLRSFIWTGAMQSYDVLEPLSLRWFNCNYRAWTTLNTHGLIWVLQLLVITRLRPNFNGFSVKLVLKLGCKIS